jgi:hypothetical protein
MDHELAERETLLLAIDDWTGVWEALWALNTLMPDRRAEVRADLAANALRMLADRGLISFIRAPWPGPLGDEDHPALTRAEVEAELQGAGWRRVPPESDVWFGATPDGEAQLLARDQTSVG